MMWLTMTMDFALAVALGVVRTGKDVER